MAHEDGSTVGYAKPPKHSQFKKGQSGNPKGRPKNSKTLKTDLSEELRQTIRIREGDREYRVSKQRAFIKAMVAEAVKGNMRAATSLIALYARVFGIANDEPENQPLSAPDQRLVDEFIDREIARRNLVQQEPPTIRSATDEKQ